jgi:hypothetical protein
MNSYSNALLKYILTHYIDVIYCKITVEEMGEFCKGKSGKNPLETALLWKADIDQAIISLAPSMTGWQPSELTSSDAVIQLSRSNNVSRMQRSLISDCILKNCEKVCKRTGYKKPETCWNEGIISRLRHYLNGDVRDATGKFTVKLTE